MVTGFVLFLALAGATPARAYDWPVKPFDHQHAIRGNFGDPRTLRGAIDATGHNPLSFHSGVDIQVPDGTPVYAIEAGVATITNRTAVAVSTPSVSPGAPLVLGYWHIDPVVGDFQYVAQHQLLGYVHAKAGHVHLAEKRFGRYVNPLRPGGLAPYVDHQPPVIRRVIVYRSKGMHELSPDAVSGTVDVVVDAYDPPPILPRPPWSGVVLSPTRISWGGLFEAWVPFSTRPQGVDFTQLPTIPISDIYAPGTWQNAANEPGDYRFWLIRRLDTRLLLGQRAIWVTVTDIRGNSSTATFRFTVVGEEPAGSR